MSTLWSPAIHTLQPYVPGEQPKQKRLLKLNTNECPHPPSLKAILAMNTVADESLRLYPDPESSLLKTAIAENYKVSPEQVFVGNGSDEVLAHAFNAFFRQTLPICFPDITYSFYPVYCGLFNIKYEAVPLDHKFRICLREFPKHNGGVIFANPNAPTGIALGLEDIETFLQKNTNTVVIVDEAYVDFGGESAVELIHRYKNLLVVQTLSKSRSLAGLRVGYGIGDVDLIAGLERVKNSFNSYPLNRFAQVGAVASIEDSEHFTQVCALIIQSRKWLSDELKKLGFEVLPSSANFVFVQHSHLSAADLAGNLRSKNILVRHFAKPRIENFLRITVGTQSECEFLIQNMKEIVEQVN